MVNASAHETRQGMARSWTVRPTTVQTLSTHCGTFASLNPGRGTAMSGSTIEARDARCRRRARAHDLRIMKRRGGYAVIDLSSNVTLTGEPDMDLDELERWLARYLAD